MEPDAPYVWLSEPGFYRIEQTGMMKELLRRADDGEGGGAWAWNVRRAYEREGRWGVARVDAVSLQQLALRPAAREYRGTLEGLSQVIAAEASLAVVADWSAVRDATWFGDYEARPTLTVSVSGEQTLHGMLDEVVLNQTDPFGAIVWTLQGGEVVVLDSKAALGMTVVVAYDVGDILSAATSEEELWPEETSHPFKGHFEFSALSALLDSLQYEVQPLSWVDNGGELGVLCTSGSTLYIRQLVPAHAQVEARLAAIRSGLGLPPR